MKIIATLAAAACIAAAPFAGTGTTAEAVSRSHGFRHGHFSHGHKLHRHGFGHGFYGFGFKHYAARCWWRYGVRRCWY